jgi:hypothetical protein
MLLAGLGAAVLGQSSGPPVSAEPTVFREVTTKLDPGGSLYVFLSTGQWTAQLGDKVRGLREWIEGMMGNDADAVGSVQQGFQVVENLVRQSGVQSVAGVGLSGIAVEPGLYRTRFVLQRAAGEREGYLWRFFGTAPHALEGLEWLPADTGYAVFGDIDLKGIWEAVKREASAARFEPLVEGMEEFSAGVAEVTGRSLEAQLGSHAGEAGVALLLDATRRITVPLPGEGSVELPEPALLVAFKVKDDALFDWIVTKMKEHPESTAGSAGGARWRSVPAPDELPFPLRPTVGRAGDYLWLASHDRAFERVVKARAEGSQGGLKGTAEFRRLARGLPEQGNSFAFVSQRFTEALWRLQEAALEQTLKPAGGTVSMAWFRSLMGLGVAPSTYAVGVCEADGMQSVSQGTQEPATALVTSAVVAPAAMLTGMTLPALFQAKGKAQEIQCMNHLKQIGLGLRIYAVDHDDHFPPDFASMKEELGNPGVLVCPADPQGALAPGAGWEGFDFSRSSYEYLKPGIGEMDEPPDTPVVRCKFHGTVVRMDGSVQRPH